MPDPIRRKAKPKLSPAATDARRAAVEKIVDERIKDHGTGVHHVWMASLLICATLIGMGVYGAALFNDRMDAFEERRAEQIGLALDEMQASVNEPGGLLDRIDQSLDELGETAGRPSEIMDQIDGALDEISAVHKQTAASFVRRNERHGKVDHRLRQRHSAGGRCGQL